MNAYGIKFPLKLDNKFVPTVVDQVYGLFRIFGVDKGVAIVFQLCMQCHMLKMAIADKNRKIHRPRMQQQNLQTLIQIHCID